VICSVALLAVLMIAGYGTYRWIERQEHRFLDYPVWREPLTYLGPEMRKSADETLGLIDTITRQRILAAAPSGIKAGTEACRFIPSITPRGCSVIRKV
jgi:hypothetical protein